jgi:hypothetical protein
MNKLNVTHGLVGAVVMYILPMPSSAIINILIISTIVVSMEMPLHFI